MYIILKIQIQWFETFLGLVAAKSDVLLVAVYQLPKYIGKLVFSDGLASITTCPKVVLGQRKSQPASILLIRTEKTLLGQYLASRAGWRIVSMPSAPFEPLD
jgi:hypothetical protein